MALRHGEQLSVDHLAQRSGGGTFPAQSPVGLEHSINALELTQSTAHLMPPEISGLKVANPGVERTSVAALGPPSSPQTSRSGGETPESEPARSADSAKAQKLKDLSARLLKKLSHNLKAEREGERDRSGSGRGGRDDD